MAQDIAPFLAYWGNPAQPQNDAAFRLYHSHRAALEKLRDLKAGTLAFLQPGKDPRGRWVPVFDESRIDEVATLGVEIENANERLKQTSNDIMVFLELSEGNPTLTSISIQRGRIIDRIHHNEKVAAVALKRALDKNPHDAPAMLMQTPDIAKAYKAIDQCKKETEKPLAVLETRLQKARKIIEPYENGGKRGF
jgi:hypothetical protein